MSKLLPSRSVCLPSGRTVVGFLFVALPDAVWFARICRRRVVRVGWWFLVLSAADSAAVVAAGSGSLAWPTALPG